MRKQIFQWFHVSLDDCHPEWRTKEKFLSDLRCEIVSLHVYVVFMEWKNFLTFTQNSLRRSWRNGSTRLLTSFKKRRGWKSTTSYNIPLLNKCTNFLNKKNSYRKSFVTCSNVSWSWKSDRKCIENSYKSPCSTKLKYCNFLAQKKLSSQTYWKKLVGT